jgi:uncharacterized SAM-binding protein YcdF (DUF218 family)
VEYLVPKLSTQLAMPLGTGILVMLVGVLVMTLHRKVLGAGLLLVGLLWIWLWATPVFSDWVRGSLEGRYPPVALESLPKAGAILVLGGAIGGIQPPRLFPDLSGAADRVWHAARLFHAGKAPLVVLSGGRLPWDAGQGPEADAMLRFLIDLGVPEEKVLLEGHSRTTYENARETRRLLTEKGIDQVILVTSALHMPRAQATFDAAGIRAIPAATDYEVLEKGDRTLLDYLPDAGALAGSSRALKEYLGIVVYRWRGWAD